MTTIRERSTAALTEALGLSDAVFATKLSREGFTKHIAGRLLDASPTLARRLDFATAWDEAVAALPEGGHITLGWHHTLSHERGEPVWFAEGHGDCWDNVDGYGPTPTDALVALAEALRERAR